MQSLAPELKKISGVSPTEAELIWQNGDRYLVSYKDLRYLCPCASCVDEHTGKRMIERSQVAEGIKPTKAVPVGRYAINIRWNDGHETGLYGFDTLYHASTTHGMRS